MTETLLDVRRARRCVSALVIASLLASALAAGSLIARLDAASTQGLTQDGDSESQALAFEVASVRENVSGPQGGSYVVRPDGVSVTNYPLRELIIRVFDIKGSLWPQYLIGTDSTIFEKRFDIQANAGRPVDPQEVAAMLRTVFAERFKMQWRKELRRVPVYELVVLREGRLGPELRPSPHDCRAIGASARAEGKLPGEAFATVKDSKGELACLDRGGPWGPGTWRNKNAGKLSELIRLAEGFAFRPIVDATGLTGNFEWRIEFTPVNGRILEVPSIFAALEQQLGLHLRPSTAEIEVLVIDSIEVPSAN